MNAAKIAIILSLSTLHLALVLPSSAGSVTCVDSEGLVKIEANCEQSCICDDVEVVATGPLPGDGRNTHDHDGCGDCTHFFLSTFLQIATGTNQFKANIGSVSANTVKWAWSKSSLADPALRWSDSCDKRLPLMTQKIASLKTSIVIC